MTIKRMPFVLLALGLVFKVLLILAWRLSHSGRILKLLLYYDPGAYHFAEKLVGILFDQRRIAPTPAESALFEVFLVVGFGIECFVVGLALRWLLRHLGRRPETTSTVPIF